MVMAKSAITWLTTQCIAQFYFIFVVDRFKSQWIFLYLYGLFTIVSFELFNFRTFLDWQLNDCGSCHYHFMTKSAITWLPTRYNRSNRFSASTLPSFEIAARHQGSSLSRSLPSILAPLDRERKVCFTLAQLETTMHA